MAKDKKKSSPPDSPETTPRRGLGVLPGARVDPVSGRFEVTPDLAVAPSPPPTPAAVPDPARVAAAADALGLSLTAEGEVAAPFTLDGAAVNIVRHCRQYIAQVQTVRTSSQWRGLPTTLRLLMLGALYFAREIIGEPAPKGDFATLKAALGSNFPRNLAGVLNNRTDIAQARQRGRITEAQLMEVVGAVE